MKNFTIIFLFVSSAILYAAPSVITQQANVNISDDPTTDGDIEGNLTVEGNLSVLGQSTLKGVTISGGLSLVDLVETGEYDLEGYCEYYTAITEPVISFPGFTNNFRSTSKIVEWEKKKRAKRIKNVLQCPMC